MRSRPLLLCLVALLPVGCASTSGNNAARSHARDPDVRVDFEYVSRIEAMARHGGVGIIWVNPPLKPKNAKAGDDGG